MLALATLVLLALASSTEALDVEDTAAVWQQLHERLDSLEASMSEARAAMQALDEAAGGAKRNRTAHTIAEAHHANRHNHTAPRNDATVSIYNLRAAAKATAREKTTGREPKPVYVILGGSNTVGARNVKWVPGRPWVSYAAQLGAAGGWAANYTKVQHAQGAMGPTMAAACAGSFIPPATRLLTIEYLPNVGYVADDQSELDAIETLLQVAQQRMARTIVVLINPGRERFATTPGCTDNMVGCTTVEHVHRLRQGMLNLTLQYGARSVLADCDTDRERFGEDWMHLNQEGHNWMYHKILEQLNDWPDPPPPSSRSRPDIGVQCSLGEELRPLVRESHGFSEIDMAKPEQGAPKIGWEAREPGSNLTLCASLPREQMQLQVALKKTKEFRSARDAKAEPSKYLMAVGMQERTRMPRLAIAAATSSREAPAAADAPTATR
jgi:hypothetical protein